MHKVKSGKVLTQASRIPNMNERVKLHPSDQILRIREGKTVRSKQLIIIIDIKINDMCTHTNRTVLWKKSRVDYRGCPHLVPGEPYLLVNAIKGPKKTSLHFQTVHSFSLRSVVHWRIGHFSRLVAQSPLSDKTIVRVRDTQTSELLT